MSNIFLKVLFKETKLFLGKKKQTATYGTFTPKLKYLYIYI